MFAPLQFKHCKTPSEIWHGSRPETVASRCNESPRIACCLPGIGAKQNLLHLTELFEKRYIVLQFRFEASKPRSVSRIMAESSKHSYDSELTIVVSNFPEDVGEDELTIHFQKEKNGGGDVDEVVVDGNIAFIIFDLPEGWSVLQYLIYL